MVVNDDPVLSITANQATQVEGNTDAADSAFVFTVTRTGNTSGASTAKWQVAGVTSGESVDPIDFGGYLPSGMVVFTAGQVTETLTVMVLADQLGEFDENLMVTLSDPTGADLLDERVATMQIINDDTMVSIQGLASSVAEGAEGSTTPVLIVTTFGRPGYLRRAMEAGVKGYLLKDGPSSVLAAAVRTVAAGGRAIAPELSEAIWDAQPDPLTDCEREIERLAEEGRSNKDIADVLDLSPGTVRNYLSEAAQKLGAANRVEAGRIVRSNGWL